MDIGYDKFSQDYFFFDRIDLTIMGKDNRDHFDWGLHKFIVNIYNAYIDAREEKSMKAKCLYYEIPFFQSKMKAINCF